MTELAGDFSVSLRAGCGVHIMIRKERETDDGFEGVIVEAYWQNAEGKPFKNAPGIFHSSFAWSRNRSSSKMVAT